MEKEKGGFFFSFGTEVASQKAFVPFEDTNAREVKALELAGLLHDLSKAVTF